MFECATARDCSIAQSEAPDAAPGVLTDYEVEFVCDVRRARAAGAADVGRSNGRGVVEGASAQNRGMVSNAEVGKGVSDDATARDRLMVDEVEIGSTRGMSRSASMFDGRMMLESTDVSDDAKRENVQISRNAEIAKGVSNLRSVKRSMADAGRIGQGVSNVRQLMTLESPMTEPQAPGTPVAEHRGWRGLRRSAPVGCR